MEAVHRMVIEKRYTPDGQFVQQAGSIASYQTARKKNSSLRHWKAPLSKSMTK
jgi:hypothetical protein